MAGSYVFPNPSSFVLDSEFCGSNSFWQKIGAGYGRASITSHWIISGFSVKAVNVDSIPKPADIDWSGTGEYWYIRPLS